MKQKDKNYLPMMAYFYFTYLHLLFIKTGKFMSNS